MRPALSGSHEGICRETALARFVLNLRHGPEDLREVLAEPRLERAIGVIYRPDSERRSHYFEARVSSQFDAYVWFEETRAVTPLPEASLEVAPDTYPFGV